MAEVVIKAENLGKKYRIGAPRATDLRNAFGNLMARINPFSYRNPPPDQLKHIKSKDKKSTEFWALEDINFEICKGEATGIIGRNGAGKSTLLKILSRITEPTTGRFWIEGRVSSVLEVGTGFHMELTGRENIYLNGTILGMKRGEIKQKFEEIVEFSGVGKFIDTPVKHYSSGMQVRLAFSVAAHLEPEILIIDEVLAVGDAEFQKKCLGKMEDVTGQGRTVLFVSHNMTSLRSLCKTGLLLDKGKLIQTGNIDHVIDYYTSDQDSNQKITDRIHYFQPWIKIHELTINGSDHAHIRVINNRLFVIIKLEFLKKTTFDLDVHIKKYDTIIASYANFVQQNVQMFDKGIYRISYDISLSEMKSGFYKLDLYFTEPFISWFALIENALNIEVINTHHHTFLNTPTLKWGSTLLSGNCEVSSIE
jgi:lipopolysaccharide transport system ATP-binding protein